MHVRVTTVRYPGRPWLTALSLLGAMLFYSGLITGTLSLRYVFDHPSEWWVTAVLLGGGALGFGVMLLAQRIFQRSQPRVIGTIDAATYAALMEQVARVKAADAARAAGQTPADPS